MLQIQKQIIINDRDLDTRAVIIENGKLEEVYFEREFNTQLVANVYQGQVENVLPGMQAAFIDVGLEQNVFLHANDILPVHPGKNSIQEVLRSGEEVMLQISKAPVDDKGPKGTCKLDLTGRSLVLMKYPQHIGVSRSISGQERGRLRKLANQIAPEDKGMIVRTAAKGKSKEELLTELKTLEQKWDEIHQSAQEAKAPQLVYQGASLLNRLVVDKLSKEVEKIEIDTEAGHQELLDLVDSLAPQLKDKVQYYSQPQPIFNHYQLEEELDKLQQRKIELDCGGNIVIDPTEALTAIDVNTAANVGSASSKETFAQTNFEAAREVVRQLKLRDIGGIIIIDFVDMKGSKEQQQILSVLEKELAQDKTKTNLVGASELGLVQLTRKRDRKTLGQKLWQKCAYCQGTGKMLSMETLVVNFFRRLREEFWQQDVEAAIIKVNPKLLMKLIELGSAELNNLEEELEMDLYVLKDEQMFLEDIDIAHIGSEQEIESYIPVRVGRQLTLKLEETAAGLVTSVDDYMVKVTGEVSKNQSSAKVQITELGPSYAVSEIL
ncbi:Rne/Rng family ribonuclease [Halanaerobacter jeridensis]|uniref:Ribonuclease G n=1 Tax=Halanaerobacter jeridensis TaxID=706427 RepID=A0A939BNW8_9FIRM|nr:ribonuclease G [Halanaerobacter jeridensis]